MVCSNEMRRCEDRTRFAVRASWRNAAWAALAIGLVSSAAPCLGQDEDETQLPLRNVVIFSSGVGFFDHAGTVRGDAQVELKFNVDDVNDLLKSMVVQDRDGGRVSTVTYGSKDPITKTLRTFSIDLTQNPTLADVLGQIRGEQIEIEAPNAISGTILGLEKRTKPADGEGSIEIDVLNLLTDEGLRSVSLENVGRIKLLNPELDAELRQALTVLAMGHSTDKKSVLLNFLGDDDQPRRVRVGYIQEAPLWKTSYRLVLDEEQSPHLQGWAIVENTTEEDWNDVQLTLVSGRPISFVMNLYDPLYISRPVVEPELFASLRPQTYGQNLAENEPADAPVQAGRAAGGGFGGGGTGGPPAAVDIDGNFGGVMDEQDYSFALNGDHLERRSMSESLSASAPSVAEAEEIGELFQYVIDTPVTLPRQRSAMLPIVNGPVSAEKVSIYNRAVHSKYPLNGLRLQNSSGVHLMQGPITVFDGGAYAGDAQIEDLPPGGERLVSYAVDLKMEVVPTGKSHPQQLTSVKLSKGVMHTEHKYRRETKYEVKNSANEPRALLIESPVDGDWKLVAPEEPDEKSRSHYRFALDVDAGDTAELLVKEELVASQQVALSNLDDATIRILLNAPEVSEEVKEALREVSQRNDEINQLVTQREQQSERLAGIDKAQERIRRNMQQLDRDTDLYQRYVKELTDQEDEIREILAEMKSLLDKENQLREQLTQFLMSLEIE